MNRPVKLLRYEEWEQNGSWYCNDLSDLCSIRAQWWAPARMLNISPAEYVQLLIDRFAPDKIKYNQEADVLVFSWKSISKMRVFKNWLNAQARKYNYVI